MSLKWDLSTLVFVLAISILIADQTAGQLNQRVSVYTGRGIRLICNISGDPGNPLQTAETNFRWEKPDGNVIAEGISYFIPSVDESHVGVYTCRAYTVVDGQPRVFVRSTELSLKGPAMPNGSEGESEQDGGRSSEEEGAQEIRGAALTEIIFSPPIIGGAYDIPMGRVFYHTCQARSTDDQGRPSSQYTYYWLDPNNSRIANTNYIYIPSLQYEQAGRYTCVAVEIATGRETRASFVLSVGGRQGGSPSPPDTNGPSVDVSSYSTRIISSPQIPLLNKRHVLTCEVSPPAAGVEYEWLVDGEVKSRSSTYEVERFTREGFSKKYECRASLRGEQIRSAPYSMRLEFYSSSQLNLREAPGPQMIVRVNDRKELHCEIDRGVRGREVEWLFNDQTLDPALMSSLRVERIDRIYVSIISLPSISLSNEGRYECRVRGNTKEAFIVVMQDESALEVNPDLQTVDENGVLELHCRANNLPNVRNTQLTWFFLGDDKSGDRRPLGRNWDRSDSTTAIETSFISTQKARVADQGYYLCAAPDGTTAIGRVIVNRRESRVIVSPRNVRVKPNRQVLIECNIYSGNLPSGTPMWRFRDGRPIETDPRFRENRQESGVGRSQLTVNDLQVSDDNTVVECYDQTNPSARDQSTINVENTCGPFTFRCLSGIDQCIEQSKRCDGNRDCSDGSDEDPRLCVECDPLDVKCDSFNGRPPIKKTFSANWRCDGENDCGNGFDESNCRNTGPSCGGTQFQCRNAGLIPRAFRCDVEPDCADGGDDEQDCRPPLIVTQPTPVNRVRTGASVRLTCTATGTPLPTIVWRHNWRCLPDEGVRMREFSAMDGSGQSCSSVTSTLTIDGVRPNDDGVYNCEAIANNGRALSSDAQVILIE